MATALVVGCTGLIGSHILSILRAGGSPSQYTSLDTIARRSLPAPAESGVVPVNEVLEKDTTKWGEHISALSPPPAAVFYALGTTRAAVGGFENQNKIEHEMNLQVAKAAKEAGTKTYVLISSTGASAGSMFGYPKMKGEIEDIVKALEFEHTIIVRPGLIVGEREQSRGVFEAGLRSFANGLGHLHSSFKDSWAQDAETIARAAVAAAAEVEKGEVKEKVWILAQKDVVRLGKTDWKA
ncbi:hypothetical protein, variant [Exophiala oligosperma]|uniref:NAD-dependent epimerase/dehydratase domain-containing protein n=1 Tax=Exophiala oligosperma TaxID=215243 RepID=A0A0D2EAX9_9EURO|nr:uncharacterized protein PV06_03546 [Exophiala oligosperma]XP_016265350.1 hypothetical protein, variant [Exophiala oligosperma]KIW45133.1 hypothetical protein PV06_03546 [Exophiala oligosperma]KIW45134.1 hypothetical protein, variant [Exophiala oligosperma]